MPPPFAVHVSCTSPPTTSVVLAGCLVTMGTSTVVGTSRHCTSYNNDYYNLAPAWARLIIGHDIHIHYVHVYVMADIHSHVYSVVFIRARHSLRASCARREVVFPAALLTTHLQTGREGANTTHS